jgi:cation diffusion facilitator family transporter
MAGDTKHIIQSLVANSAIATAKGVAAVITGSGALLAETIHSAADCGNQLLLLMGVKRSRKPPDAKHPLGYGRAVYFWSFMVALLLFTGGGMFSIYEGVHKYRHPETPGDGLWLGIGILAFSLAIEGWATFSNIVELNKRRRGKPFMRYLRETKDSDLVVIFGENSAAVLGLTLALIAIVIAKQTGDGRWDAVGSLAIGVVLIGVAVFLAIEVKSLLLGESADPELDAAVRELVKEEPAVEDLMQLISIQQGPGEVMVMLKLRFATNLTSEQVATGIDTFESKLRARRPEVRWLFVEPDLHDKPGARAIA